MILDRGLVDRVYLLMISNFILNLKPLTIESRLKVMSQSQRFVVRALKYIEPLLKYGTKQS